MVGVPKSTGCSICRKRKIKCDESWPSCTNCQKNGKCCTGPPARHTFKDSGPTLSPNATSPSSESGLYSDSTDKTKEPACKQSTQLNVKRSQSGAVVHKFRFLNGGPMKQNKSPRSSRSTPDSTPPRSPQLSILRQPSPSQHQAVACALIDAVDNGSVSHRMSAFGPFIREVPSRIGHNAALDAAAVCLVNAHLSMVHEKNANEIANPRLYLRAVQTLQTCLEDPWEGMSSNTLCASVILGLVEALAGPRAGNRYLAHVGGAGRLMEIQGPGKCQEPFAKELLKFSRGGIVINSIYERKSSFLTSPAWIGLAFDTTGLSFDDGLYTDILRYMASFPALLRELRDLERSMQPPEEIAQPDCDLTDDFEDKLSDLCPNFDFSTENFENSLAFLKEPYLVSPSCNDPSSNPNTTPRTNLIIKLETLRDDLHKLGTHLRYNLASKTAATETPSTDPTSPIPTSLHFTSCRVTVAYSCYWSLVLLINKLLLKLLPPYESTSSALETENRIVALEICKTWEEAWASKPIGAFHTGLSFVVAYEYCTPEVQVWILKGLNGLLDHQAVDSFRWSDEVIGIMSGKLAGEGPDLVFTHKNTSK